MGPGTTYIHVPVEPLIMGPGTTSLQRTLPKVHTCTYMQYIFKLPKDETSLQGTKWLVPKYLVPLSVVNYLI